MKTNIKKCFLIILFLISVIFSGCSSKINTNMSFDTNLSGSRQMEIKIPKSFVVTKINGGINALDAFIRLSHPEDIFWEKVENDPLYLTYIFRIDFNDKDDYIKKVENILKRQSDIVFVSSDNPISNGIIIKEDFSSEDLLSFINEGLFNEGLIDSKDVKLWDSSTTKVIYGNNVISTEPYINVSDMNSISLENIAINTTVKEAGSIIRSIGFKLPANLDSETLDKVINYLKSRVPDESSSTLETSENLNIFKIEFSVADYSELLLKTNYVFDNYNGELEFNKNKSELFNDQIEYIEEIHLDNFISPQQNNKIYLNYNLSFEGTQIDKVKIKKNSEWIDAGEYLKDNVLSISGQADVFHVNVTTKKEYKVDSISINMTDNNDGTFERVLCLKFNDENGSVGAKKAADYFTARQAPFTNIEAKDSECLLTMSGTAQEINVATNSNLGAGNKIQYKSDIGFNPFNRYLLEDNINLSEFLNQISYDSKEISYSYTNKNEIESATKTNKATQKQSDIDPESNNRVNCVINPDEETSINVNTKSANILFLSLLAVAFIITIVLLIVIIKSAVKAVKMRDFKLKLDNGDILVLEKMDEPCQICGATVFKGMRYCNNCGNIIGEIVEIEIEKQP